MDAAAHYSRGNIYADKSNYEKAVIDYSMAIEINPQMGKIYYSQAVCYWKLRDFDKAWVDVKKADALGAVMDQRFIFALRMDTARN